MLRITEVPVQLAITTQPFLVRNELGKSDSQITNYTLLHSTFFSKLHVLLFVVCLWFLLLFDWLVGFFSRQSFFMYPELFWYLLCRPDPCQLQDPPVSLSLPPESCGQRCAPPPGHILLFKLPRNGGSVHFEGHAALFLKRT